MTEHINLTQMINKQNRLLHLIVPAKAEYLSLVRLVVSAIAKECSFTDESIADLKVALSEAAANVVRHAYGDGCSSEDSVIEIICNFEDNCLAVRIIDHGRGMTVPPPPSEGLGFGIIGSLMDKVDVETGKGGTTVTMEKSPATTRS
jgi:serine/threonine-protein kinase RsbW